MFFETYFAMQLTGNIQSLTKYLSIIRKCWVLNTNCMFFTENITYTNNIENCWEIHIEKEKIFMLLHVKMSNQFMLDLKLGLYLSSKLFCLQFIVIYDFVKGAKDKKWTTAKLLNEWLNVKRTII